MTQTAKAQEPSMEEILASIRRIIADDDAGKAAKPADAPKPAPPPPAAPQPVVGGTNQSDLDAMLADLDATPQPMPPLPEPPPAAPPPIDVLDLTEAMAAPAPPPAASFRTIAAADVVFTERQPLPPVEPPPAPPRAYEEPQWAAAPPPPPRVPERSLISASTIAAVDSAFNSLAHTVIGQNARTLEDLVKEMLRPMLKSWLDDNLPAVVDRIVRAEIERVSRGR